MIKKLILISLLLTFLVVTLPIKAQQAPPVNNAPPVNVPAPTLEPGKTLDLTCMQNAIEKKETAIAAALDTYYQAVKNLLATRKSELKAAWGLSDKKQRQLAIVKAWKNYRTGLQKARKEFSQAKRAAWKQFYTDRKACRGSVLDDNTNESVDQNL